MNLDERWELVFGWPAVALSVANAPEGPVLRWRDYAPNIKLPETPRWVRVAVRIVFTHAGATAAADIGAALADQPTVDALYAAMMLPQRDVALITDLVVPGHIPITPLTTSLSAIMQRTATPAMRALAERWNIV